MTHQQPKSHFVPRTREGRIVTGIYLFLFLCVMPPVTHRLLDRPDVWIGGVPFFFASLLVLYCLLICVVVWAFRRGL
jgi:hypothetical protein